MTKAELKERLITAVRNLQGCKATELPPHIMPKLGTEVAPIGEDFVEALDELIATGDLVEVEYILPIPGLEGRVKSFLLPKGTEVRLGNVPL